MARSAIVAILCLVGVITFADSSSAGSTPFTDIGGSTFRTDIEWLHAAGITTGCTPTRYCPTNPVTRAEMASFLVRMFALPSTATDFFDDDDGSTHEADIDRVAAAGVTSGCTATRFCPDAPVTRAQMASFLPRAAALTIGAGRDYFYDDNTSTHEHDIDRAAAGGIASGCGTWRYCPTANVTREQMAGFLHRVVSPITPPDYPAPPPPTPTPNPTKTPKPTATPGSGCHSSYPTVCIPPPPPDLDCPEVPYTNFTVVGSDPHDFDRDRDGIGCEE